MVGNKGLAGVRTGTLIVKGVCEADYVKISKSSTEGFNFKFSCKNLFSGRIFYVTVAGEPKVSPYIIFIRM